MIGLTIDGREVSVPSGTTILEAAEQAGISIPILCYFAHTTANGLCRLCVVEIEGTPGLPPACITSAQDGSVVHTRSEKIDRVRRTILEMLAASVNLSETPEVLEMLDAYEAQRNRFGDGGELESTIIDDNPVYIRDYTKCVLCWRCVQVCAEDAQYTYAIDFGGRGFATSISTFLEKPLTETTCVFCGQCVGVCPSGALKAKREHFLEQGIEPEEIFEITRLSGRGKRSKVGPHLG